jgi:hypothetical protein
MDGNLSQGSEERRKFLGIQFVNCGAYGRLYKNKEGTAYVGHCPKCGAALKIRIDPSEGTSARFFRYYCP